MYGTDAYAVHSSACRSLITSARFSNGAFHTDYSLDNHCNALCAAGRLDIALLENGSWLHSFFGTGYDSDTESLR